MYTLNLGPPPPQPTVVMAVPTVPPRVDFSPPTALDYTLTQTVSGNIATQQSAPGSAPLFAPHTVLQSSSGSFADSWQKVAHFMLIGQTGSGKTLAALWLIRELNGVRPFEFLICLCPKATYESPFNTTMRNAIPTEQCIFIGEGSWQDDLDAVLELARQRFMDTKRWTALVLDDVLTGQYQEVLSKLDDLLKTGRHSGVQVFAISQGSVNDRTYGAGIRSNLQYIVGLKNSSINELSKRQEWVLAEDKQAFKSLANATVDEANNVGVLVSVVGGGSISERVHKFKASITPDGAIVGSSWRALLQGSDKSDDSDGSDDDGYDSNNHSDEGNNSDIDGYNSDSSNSDDSNDDGDDHSRKRRTDKSCTPLSSTRRTGPTRMRYD